MIVRNKGNIYSLLFAWHGTILPVVLPTLIFVLVVSSVIGLLASHHLLNVPEVPAIGFTIFGIILSLFLSFRNNASYDRWWEGRKLWGALIANTRHISRDSNVLTPEHRHRLMYQVMVFASLLRDRLRKNKDITITEQFALSGLLDHYDINRLTKDINAPQLVLNLMQQELVQALKKGEISDIIYTSLTQHIVELGNEQAGCDRIASTPLPFTYSVLVHRTIYGFCLILPFSLEASLGIWTPVLVGLIAYLFLGFDAISMQLEEPFGNDDNDLPLNTIVRMIEREMLNSLNEPMPPALEPVKYKLT